jgi:hypothetical protein
MLWELWIVVIVAAVGLADAVVGGQADLAALFAAVTALALLAAVRHRFRRDQITVRSDIGVWLRHTAETEGTTAEELADRTLSAARSDGGSRSA